MKQTTTRFGWIILLLLVCGTALADEPRPISTHTVMEEATMQAVEVQATVQAVTIREMRTPEPESAPLSLSITIAIFALVLSTTAAVTGAVSQWILWTQLKAMRNR